MADIKPTPEDMKCDLAAALKRAEKATPGPWVNDPPWGLPWEVGPPRRFDKAVTVCRTLGDARPLNLPQKDSEQATDDAAFIAAARTALPAAVRRALAAEAILRRLSAAYEGLDDVYDVAAEARRYFGLEE